MFPALRLETETFPQLGMLPSPHCEFAAPAQAIKPSR